MKKNDRFYLTLLSIPVYPMSIFLDKCQMVSLATDSPLCESDVGGISFISEKAKRNYLMDIEQRFERRESK